MDKDNLIEVGIFKKEFNDILDINMPVGTIYQSKGLPTHMVNRKHYKCLKYINYISDIINNPDYIGINPNENGDTIELIKRFKDNVMIGIKLDIYGNYLYVSTMHDVQESKIQRRLHGGRLKEINKDIDTTPLE
jgi:hypothetical protein